MVNTKKQTKTQGQFWKFQWRQQCRARKEQRNTPSFSKLKRRMVDPTRFQNQSMHASWRLTSPRENEWNHVYRRIMKITSQAKGIIQWLVTTWFTHIFRCLKRWKFRRRKQQWTRNGKKLETIPAWQLDKVQSEKEVFLEAQRHKKEIHFATWMDICQLKKCGVRATIPEVQGKNCASRRHCERRLWNLCSLCWTGLISIANDGRKSNGCHCPTTRLWRTSSWRPR